MSKGLTISIIFEAESGNYGEGFGNVSTLKKLTRGNGKTYTYFSRQSLRYNIVEQMEIDNTPVSAEGSGKKVIQFQADAYIDEYPEIDLFGYMKTKGDENAQTRSAVVRLSNAVSLEPYHSDMDFLTNMGLAQRINEDNSIAQNEIHKSFYSYTITIDLDRVGKDDIGDKVIEISKEEKAKRIKDLLNTLTFLYRDIKGRRENLSPVFAIGGIYSVQNPIFMNRLKTDNKKLNISAIKSAMQINKEVKQNTLVGYIGNIFENDNEIEELSPLPIGNMFNTLSSKVEEYYLNETN